MVQAQYMEEEEEQEEDDITEIREGEEGDYYDDYQEFEEPQQQPAAPPPSAGSQLMGLVCPTCRQMCKGVQALKEHMALCKGGGREAAEELQDSLCHICDKTFKNHRTLDNHLKKQHGLAGSSRALGGNRGRGRPKKSPALSDWGGEGGYDGGYPEPGVSQSQPGGLHRGRPVGQVAPQRVTETVNVPLPRPGQHGSSSPRGARGRGLPRGGFSR